MVSNLREKGDCIMRKHAAIALATLALTLLSGCGEPEDTSSWPEAEKAVQWKTEGFAEPGKLEEEQVFWTGQYLPWEHVSRTADGGTEELGHLDFGVCGELFWHFGVVRDFDGFMPGLEREYVLEIYDTASGEHTVKRFSQSELGLEGELGCLNDMDMIDGEHYVFRWVNYEQDEGGMYRQTMDRMVYTDLADHLWTADFRKTYLEKEIDQERLAEQPAMLSINWRCDGKGNICVINRKENGSAEIYLFDRDGEALLEYEGTAGQQIVEPLRTSDGELILPVYDEAEKYYEFLWVDAAAGELRPLAQLKASAPCIRQIYGMLGDDIYYRSGERTEEGIVRWNVKSGRRVQVLGFQTAGIDHFETMLVLRQGQTPVLCLSRYKRDEGTREWLTELTEQRPTEDGSIRVASLTGYDSRVAECAVQTSMETPGFRYEYEDASAQEARDRILIELSQGKGPDILSVTPQDLYMLEEKGLLLDIGEVISPDIREKLLPGALEIGTVDERLLGVPVGVLADTLVVAGDTWPEDTWRWEELLDLMEEGKLTGAIRNAPNKMNGRYRAPALTVLSLVNYSLEDSFLIDWENRKCHFDDERFIRLLELTYADLNSAPTDADLWLNEGEDILCGYFMCGGDFLDFFARMEAEDGHIVGYPTEGDSGSYLKADGGGVLVVNANIAGTEAAECFLENLLGQELQAKINLMGLSARRLSPEDYIVEDENGVLRFMSESRYSPEVPVFQDGATALHRARDFLESCVAAPPGYSRITAIIAEELDAMYAENKSPMAAAEIINSRVQIYLDETY